MQSEKPKPLPNSSKRAGKCPGYDIDVDENGPHIIRCDHYCPHCDIHMTYDEFIENDGDRSYPVWKCNNQECNTKNVHPYYFEYADVQ
jgi:hypothetical protein